MQSLRAMDNRLVCLRPLWKSQIVFFLLFFAGLHSSDIKTRSVIDQIPREDQEKISYFFRHAIFWDSFGYVLLGDKPCAISHYNKVGLDPRSWWTFFSPHNLKMRKGWLAWLKYEKLFPQTNFLFLEEDSDLTSAHFIILIHQGRFHQKILDHQKDFQSVLQHPVEGRELLNQAKNRPLLSQVLENHDGLIGILLGFGRNNSWEFHENSEEMDFFTDEKEKDQMKRYFDQQGSLRLFTGSFLRDFNYLPLPGFRVNPSDPETQKLKRTYSENREKIRQYYEGKDFLEATLTLLCRHSLIDVAEFEAEDSNDDEGHRKEAEKLIGIAKK